VIRQAISCDICGSDKQKTNNWFVAYDQGGELRVSGWNSRNRLRAGAKHLCGQTCLHKLLDDFMAKILAVRVPSEAAEEGEVQAHASITDVSLTLDAAYGEIESSARLLTPTEPTLPKLPKVPKLPKLKPSAELVAMPVRSHIVESMPELPAEPPSFASRNWRTEAWERERERERCGNERSTERVARRRSN
jgi:hypothetical protein